MDESLQRSLLSISPWYHFSISLLLTCIVNTYEKTLNSKYQLHKNRVDIRPVKGLERFEERIETVLFLVWWIRLFNETVKIFYHIPLVESYQVITRGFYN